MPVYRVMDHVLAEELDGEVLAIDERTGVYYSMGGSAAVIWAALTSGVSLDAVASASPAIDAEIASFVSQLCEVELLAADTEAQPDDVMQDPSPSLSGLSGDVKPPVLGVHDEMQEILLFDPIHEVDNEQGWPHRGEEAAR